MAYEINRLRRPIDVVHLIHKALRALAVRVEKEAAQLDAVGGLHNFNMLFNLWATNLIMQTELKREHIRGTSVAVPPGDRAQQSQPGYHVLQTDGVQSEPVISAPREDPLEAAMTYMDDMLLDSVEAVLTVLNDEIGKTSVITRTKQHVHRQVVALRIAQEDCFETEEAFVLRAIRDSMTERRQLQIARSLLIDEGADDPRWMIDWVASELDPAERRQLAEIETRFDRLTD